jgi:predicted dehydrogenase
MSNCLRTSRSPSWSWRRPTIYTGKPAIQALEAGKHVLSETPMATTLPEVERIIALTERTGLKYHMGNQVRWAYCLQDVQRMIAGGDLGEVFYGEGEYLHDMEDIASPGAPPL